MLWQLPEMFTSFDNDSQFSPAITEPVVSAFDELVVSSRAEAEDELKPSLFNHWVTTSTHNLSRLRKLDRGQRTALLRNPLLFAGWGAIGTVEVIGMHYDYFIGD